MAAALTRDAGGRLFFVFWSSLVVIDLAAASHAPPEVAVAGVVLVVATGSWGQRLGTGLAAAGMGWLFVNGFLVNQLGVLRWSGTGDLWRLLLLLAVAFAAGRAGTLDGFLTRGDRADHSAWVRSHDGRGRPGSSAEQEKHAVGG